MERRSVLAAAGAVLASGLAGCQAVPDSGDLGTDDSGDTATPTQTPETLSESEVETCARAYIEENVVDVAEKRDSGLVRNAESPTPRVVGVNRADGIPVYEVRAFWGITYYGYTIDAHTVEEAPPDPPETGDLPLDAVEGLRSTVDEAVDTGEPARTELFDVESDDLETLRTVFGDDLREATVVVDHRGTPVELAVERRDGLVADYEEHGFYYVVNGTVYRTDEATTDPTDGERIDC